MPFRHPRFHDRSMHAWAMPVGGLLPLIVLKMLSKNQMHGYQIEEEPF